MTTGQGMSMKLINLQPIVKQVLELNVNIYMCIVSPGYLFVDSIS